MNLFGYQITVKKIPRNIVIPRNPNPPPCPPISVTNIVLQDKPLHLTQEQRDQLKEVFKKAYSEARWY